MNVNKKTKILWLKPTKGNVSIGRYLIAKNLEKSGFKVEILECSGLSIFKALLHALKSDFDVIVGTTHLGLAIGGIIKLLKKKPFLADFVDQFSLLREVTPAYLYPLMYVTILLEKLSLKIADAVVVVPKQDYEKISKKRRDVYKVNLCIDLEKFLNVGEKTVKKAKEILKKAGVNLNKPLIVYVGGFSKIYNLNLLIQAMERLQDFQLIMIGGGELESELKKLTKEKKLNNVFFLGYQPNELIPGFLKLSSVGVTLAEIPRQLKIYEYLASGLSVVVPEAIVRNEDFEFGEYCIGIKLGIESVILGIRKASKNNPNCKSKLEKYDCKVVAEIYLKVIKIVVKRE